MEQRDKDLQDISLFIKVGIVVLSIICIIGLGVKIVPSAITVTSSGRHRDIPIYCVDTEERKLSLTFDVAWGNEDIDIVLDILDRNHVKATFFVTGEWVEQYPDDLKKIAVAGHDLANHGENHEHMTKLSEEKCIDEIMNLHKQVKELTGLEMNLFRPPYGDYNNTVVGKARDCGYYTIQWDVDSLDWKDYGVDNIVKRTTESENLGNGSIILLHCGGKYTAEALEEVVLGLQEQGYDLLPVSQLIHKGDYEVDYTGRQFKK